MRGKTVHPSHLALVAGAESAPAAVGALPSFDEVYARHSGYVAGLAGRILGRNDEVPDVVQEVFLIVHRRLGHLRAVGALRTWLGRITVREASRRVRWRRIRRWLGQPDDAADVVADDGSAAELRPMIALLYSALDRVPFGPRAAWVLRYLLDEPLDVVAEICGCSTATVKRRIAIAEVALRPALSDREEEST